MYIYFENLIRCLSIHYAIQKHLVAFCCCFFSYFFVNNVRNFKIQAYLENYLAIACTCSLFRYTDIIKNLDLIVSVLLNF